MIANLVSELYLTDGTTVINLLSKQNGFCVQAWTPTVADIKNGGIFQNSPLSEGRRLVARQYDNAFENFTLAGRAGEPDLLIYQAQEIRRLLEKAVAYWTSDWQDTPVYLIARGFAETNVRYALLYDYRAPGDGNPFVSPFTGPDASIFDAWPLILERGHWTETAPGTGTCVQLAGTGTYTRKASYFPATGTDDCYVTGGVMVSGNTNLVFGNLVGAVTDAGLRFVGVDVPQGTTILAAYLRLISTQNLSATTMRIDLVGEDADDAATFSSAANFAARPRTTALVNWDSITAKTTGEVFVSPDITTIIQEIVNRAGWVSGNDLVIFLEDDSSTADAHRDTASFENVTYNAPELVIVFETQTLGRAATCDNEVYVANKQNKANMTDVYSYDASAGTFSPNLMESALPYALFPATPVAGDILYIGCDTSLADSGPFCSAVWDILAAQADITGVAYEIYTGAWNAHTVQDNTATGGIPFSVTGINSMHWVQPSTWVTTAINGVTAYWVRIRITSVGGGPTAPTQQNRQPYSVTWASALIDDAQVGGDIPALALHKLFAHSGTRAVLTDLVFQRAIIGLRSTARGASFVPALNFSDEQNPTGITAAEVASAATSMVADARAPSGRAIRYNIIGAGSPNAIATIDFDSTIATQYYGRYRAFVRLTVDTGTADDITLSLYFGPSNTGVQGRTLYKAVAMPYIDEWLLVDFGQVVLPASNVLSTQDVYPSFDLQIGVTNTADTDLKLYDLWLIPVDENAVEGLANSGSILFSVIEGEFLEIESILYPKAPALARAIHRLESNERVVSLYQPITAAPVLLQANADQRIHVLTAILDQTLTNAKQQSFGYAALSLQTERQQRYLSMRGNR